MRACQVNLRQEVTRNDALAIIDWMEDLEVTRYLNEAANISTEIKNTINRVNISILTHLFNRNGIFHIICYGGYKPIGFLRLVHDTKEAEMVVVIGDRDKWGQGYGTQAINEGLKYAFFEWRIPRVIAKIDKVNSRSIKAFEKSGFRYICDLKHSRLYGIMLEEYIYFCR